LQRKSSIHYSNGIEKRDGFKNGILEERLQHKPLENTLSDTQAFFAKPLHKYLLHMPSKKKPCVRPIVAF